MALLQTDEPNIIDDDAPNWRIVVYPLLAGLIVVFAGLGYYFYQQNQKNEAEVAARAAMIKATTPEEFVKVAADFPRTIQASLALLHAADLSFYKHDYDGALADYRKITANSAVDATLRDAAQVGIASSLEASGKNDEAIAAYLEVAHRGDKSAYAPFAYDAVAKIYQASGDKQNEGRILQESSHLNGESVFTKEAQFELKQLNASKASAGEATPPSLKQSMPAPAPVSSAPPAK